MNEQLNVLYTGDFDGVIAVWDYSTLSNSSTKLLRPNVAINIKNSTL